MSELIQMRQRIKAIETIKKVTYAMRIISMANHNQLRLKKNPLKAYDAAIILLWNQRHTQDAQHKNICDVFFKKNNSEKKLVILLGSQKGLCGNFTSNVLSFFAKENKENNSGVVDIIAVGKKLIDMLQEYTNEQPIIKFKFFNTKTMDAIAEEITNYILNNGIVYQSISIYFNNPKTFFTQKTESLRLLPLDKKNVTSNTFDQLEGYSYVQDHYQMDLVFIKIIIRNKIKETLLNGLIAEHAARFLAMDSSTKNASNLLDVMKLSYNKTRQTNITRELTDLIGGL